jgi:hypothetical protein
MWLEGGGARAGKEITKTRKTGERRVKGDDYGSEKFTYPINKTRR